MSKNTLKYFTFLSGGLSVISGIAGLATSGNKVQLASFTLMFVLAVIGAVLFIKLKKYNNGTGYLHGCINAIHPPSDEWTFHSVKNEAELKSVWKISQSLYGDTNVDYSTVLSWWKCYPAGIFILYKQANIVGYFSMWPIKKGTFKHITSGRRHERELKRQSLIGKDSTEQRNFWYVTNIVIQKKYRKTNAIKVLLSESLRKWVNEGNLGDQIQICAFAYSKDGQLLIKSFGFHELKNAEETLDKLPLYVFTSTNANINMLVNRLLVHA